MTHVYTHETIPIIKMLSIPITPTKVFLIPLCSLLSYLQAIYDLISTCVDYFTFSRIFSKWNHTVCAIFGLASFCIIILRFSHVACINSSFCTIIAHILLQRYLIICLFIYLLIDTLVSSIFNFILNKAAINIFKYKYWRL